MVIETVPKDILDKLNAGMEITGITGNVPVVNPVGQGLTTLSYGSTDGGTTWYPIKIDAGGYLDFNKYLVENGVSIVASEWAQNNTRTVFTVGAGKILYLTSASISVFTSDASSGHAYLYTEDVNTTILSLKIHPAGSNQTTSISPSPPIKLVAGKVIRITSDRAGLAAHTNISGWLVDA